MVRELIPDILAERARLQPDDLFVRCGDKGRTFGEMYEQADLLASGLHAPKGARVASILPNCIEHVELIFACALLGAIHVPINVFLKGQFLRYQLLDSGASCVFADDPGLVAVDELRDHLPDLEDTVATQARGGDVQYMYLTSYLALDGRPDVQLEPSDTMAIIYTSGTTGLPKGCMLPHGYHTATDNSLLEYAPGDVLYTALPLFHGWARGMLFAALIHGLTIHIDPEFSATNVLRRLADTRATVFSGVGAMGMAMLAQFPSDLDRAHDLRVAFMIPFAPDAEAEFTRRFGPRVQSQMYGQTETGAITFTPLGRTGKPGTVGHASPTYDVRIVDDDDHDAAEGEVVVRSKHPDTMYTGYWSKPDETAEAMRGGWHHTGDLARMDDEGYITFVDRKKDSIRRRGENISSVQLEAAIVAHDKILEAAVVAVPSELTEDDIKACIVLNANEPISQRELFGYFRDRLPYFAIPRYVEVVDALPKTATMRVQKHILRAAGVTEKTWDFEKLGLVVDPSERR